MVCQAAALLPDHTFSLNVATLQLPAHNLLCNVHLVLNEEHLQNLVGANLAVVHGGIGSVKGCIAAEVPILV